MRISFLPAATEDIVSQVNYLLDKFAYDAAERFPEAVHSAAQFIVEQPHAGALTMAGLRSWVVPGFPRTRIFYHCPTANDLHIVRVLHMARDIDSIFENE